MLFMHFRITVRALVVIATLSLCVEPRTNALGAQADRQNDWDTTLRAAESEGQLTIYGCCYDYDRILEGFKKKFHKIKVATVAQPGGQLRSRIPSPRRGEKYFPNGGRAAAAQAGAACPPSPRTGEMRRAEALLAGALVAPLFRGGREFAVGTGQL